MITLPVVNGVAQGQVPSDAVRLVQNASQCVVYQPGDTVPVIPPILDLDASLRRTFEEGEQRTKASEFAAFKARSGAPAYKNAAVHIAAEKLGVTAEIEAAITALVVSAGDRSLKWWWQQADRISRNDSQWAEIEAAVDWKTVAPEDLFVLASQLG